MDHDERWRRAAGILDELFALPEAERAAAWARHPESDPAIRAEVEGLLAANHDAEGYLDTDVLTPRKPVPGAQVGPWRLMEEIAQGGMSVVYRAERATAYEQRVAIKVIALPVLLTDAMAKQILSRFEAERQIAARLEHPNICKLHDGGITSEGLPYLVLEYVEGQDLLRHCEGKPLPLRLALVREIALAVHYAHQHLIVHRDLKPSNVLVTPSGHVKLLDFGIAKALDPLGAGGERTSTVFRAATPGYASPEQMRGADLTTATDVYSLGMLLDKVTGETKPSDVRAIVQRATRDEPSERYASAADLAADLERFEKGLPVEAHQRNFRYIVSKLARRHRAAFVTAGLAVALLLGAVVVTLQKNREISRQRERAETVASFLQGLFQASDPELNQGNRLTTRQLLDEGAQSIATAAIDTRTRLDLTETIAGAYAGLGLFDRSSGLYSGILDQAAGDPQREAAAWTGLAASQAQLGRFEDAEKAGRQAVESARRIRPANPSRVAAALEQHCLALFQAAKYGPAAKLCGEAVSTAENAKLPAIEQAKYFRSYGRSLKNTGDFARAGVALQRSLALSRGVPESAAAAGPASAPGRSNPTTAIALDELGGLYFRQGKFDDAQRYFEQAIAMERALYPEGHVTLARSLNNLANTHATLRRYDRAEQIYREAHTHYRKFLGENSAELATSLSNLAICQQGTGRLAEAAATLEQVLAVHETNTGKERLPYWNTALKYANLRLEQNRPADAARWASNVVAALERMQPLPRIERGFARVVLAAALIESGRGRDAVVPAQAARDILAAAVAPTHWMRAYADAAYAGAIATQGKTAEARQLLAPLYKDVAAARGKGSWRAEWIYKLGRAAGL